MKSIISTFTAIAIALLSFTAVAKPNDIGVRKFESSLAPTSISVGSMWEVKYVQAPGKTSLTVEVPKRLIDYVDVHIKKDVLSISLNYNERIELKSNEKIVAVVSSPSIKHFKIDGLCRFDVQGDLKIDNFALNAAISSTFICNNIHSPEIQFTMSGTAAATVGTIDCDMLNVNISGASSLTVKGDVKTRENPKLSMSVASNFSCDKIICNNIEIGTSGTSKAITGAIDCNSLNAMTTGASYITIKGDVKSRKDVNISGSVSGEFKCGNVSCVNFDTGASGTSSVTTDNVECANFNASVTGAGHLNFEGDIKTRENFRLESTVSGNAGFRNISCTKAELFASGTARIKTSDIICKNMTAETGGGANLNIRNLKVEKASLTSLVAADASIGVIDAIDITLAASGTSHITMDYITSKSVTAEAGGGAKITLSGQTDLVDFSANVRGQIEAKALKANKGTAKFSGSSNIKCSVKELTQPDHSRNVGIFNSYK